MHLGQGGPDHPSSEGGGEEEAGGDEDGGADEGGEEGAVDGLSPGTWLGEKRSMPRSVKKKSKNIFQNTISIYLFPNPPNSYNNFVINVGRRKFAELTEVGLVRPYLTGNFQSDNLKQIRRR